MIVMLCGVASRGTSRSNGALTTSSLSMRIFALAGVPAMCTWLVGAGVGASAATAGAGCDATGGVGGDCALAFEGCVGGVASWPLPRMAFHPNAAPATTTTPTAIAHQGRGVCVAGLLMTDAALPSVVFETAATPAPVATVGALGFAGGTASIEPSAGCAPAPLAAVAAIAAIAPDGLPSGIVEANPTIAGPSAA